MKRVAGGERITVKSGFTIVELLIVIVVIAILAAVTIVAYNGISKNARQTSLLADVKNAGTIMETDRAASGSYSTTASGAHGGLGIPSGPGVTILYHSDGSTYCITARSSYDGVNSYYISNTSPKPTLGQCPEDAGVAVTTGVGDGTVGAAQGTGTAATLAGPAGLAADASGNLYFTDQQSSRIRKMTTGLTVTNLAGSGSTGTTDGNGSAALFNWPQALTVGPSGVLYIADTNNSLIRTLTGTTSAPFAGGTQGTGGTVGASTGAAVQFNTPRGIVYNPVSNTLYIADSQSHRIRVLDMTSKLIANIGTMSGGWKDGASGVAQFNYPQGLAVDSTGLVYVADTLNHRIRTIDNAGNVVTIAGSGAQGSADGDGLAAQFKSPMAIAVSSNGTVYVADTGNNLIRKIAPGAPRTVTTIAGDGTASFKDAAGTAAQFNAPQGIAIGSDGKLYVTDRLNNRIRILTI